MARRPPLTIGGVEVRPGSSAQIDLPVSRLITGAEMAIPVFALHGRYDGPSVWLSAAIHGDELNGVEIVNRVVAGLDPKEMHGSVYAVPVVNLYGFITGDRYLPDRRDLNRSFPGSARGSLAARVAHLLMTEIVAPCDVGIDLHTASDHRTNLPQVRADLDDADTLRLAKAFGPSVMVHSKPRKGTLRGAAARAGKTVLLYEAGEPWRFNHDAIAAGVTGVRRVLGRLKVAKSGMPRAPKRVPASRSTRWMRATRSGIVHLDVANGEMVEAKQPLGTIDDAFGKRLSTVRSSRAGMVIGQTLHPLVNRGDAVVHIASIEK